MTAALPQAHVGVIGECWLLMSWPALRPQEVVGETPFGSPSDALTVGQLGGMGVAFLPRHGRGHSHHALRAAGTGEHPRAEATRCAVGDLGRRRGQ